MSDPLLCPRSLLAVRSDPNRPRLYLIHRQINDHINLATSYASFAHRLKLDHSKHVRLFSDLSHNLSNLISSFPPPPPIRLLTRPPRHRHLQLRPPLPREADQGADPDRGSLSPRRRSPSTTSSRSRS
ncbi:Galacturonosyltransferase 8 [Acorus calamus]|uniref:Galacturonosyltransferase 8 n=1 Tax=Acorus calamus TaxID=4465 RepID=A0AAV9D9K0_ACOCL|nr:Galacturonosyltransferase 8 [Acorus calamus]